MPHRFKSIIGVVVLLAVSVAIPLVLLFDSPSPHRVTLRTFLVPAIITLPLLLIACVRFAMIFLDPHARKATQIGLTIVGIGIRAAVRLLFGCAGITFGILELIRGSSYIGGLAFLLIGILLLFLEVGNLLKIRRETRESMAATLKKHGFCPHCSYDLRASSGRCPECGRAIQRSGSQNIEV